LRRNTHSWEDIFPPDETQSAAKFLVKTWERIAKKAPRTISYTLSEPKITESLHYYLDCFKGESGLTGFWINENQKLTKKSKSRIRMDITYFSNASPQQQLQLIFEFKKISQSTLAKYYGKNGMGRFVYGDYALKLPLALMVGLHSKGNKNAVTKSLHASLSTGKVASRLKMIFNDGSCVNQPSAAIPSVAEFDTEHKRLPGKAPPATKKTIVIAHIFLDCP